MTTYALAPEIAFGLAGTENYLVYTYASGGLVPATTYSDNGTTPHANPIVLDSNGAKPIWIARGTAYRFIYKASTDGVTPGATLEDVDPILVQDADAIVGAATGYGKCSVPVMAVSIKPSTTNGCADIAAVAMGAGKPDIVSLDFDTTTEESGQFFIRMPTNWNEGTITFDVHWSHAATTVNFGVAFALSALAVSDDDTLNASFGTEVVVTDTGGTTNDLYISAESAAMTVAGTPTTGDFVCFKIARKTGNAADTLAIDARLMGLTIYVTTDTAVG